MPFKPTRTEHAPSATAAGPTAIGRLMSRLMSRTGYDREHAAGSLETAWQQVAPESLRGASQPGLVRRGVLEGFVSHSALVQEMGFHKRDVVARLGELVPAEGITDIRCRLLPDAGR
jgi:hypothetical protein